MNKIFPVFMYIEQFALSVFEIEGVTGHKEVNIQN